MAEEMKRNEEIEEEEKMKIGLLEREVQRILKSKERQIDIDFDIAPSAEGVLMAPEELIKDSEGFWRDDDELSGESYTLLPKVGEELFFLKIIPTALLERRIEFYKIQSKAETNFDLIVDVFSNCDEQLKPFCRTDVQIGSGRPVVVVIKNLMCEISLEWESKPSMLSHAQFLDMLSDDIIALKISRVLADFTNQTEFEFTNSSHFLIKISQEMIIVNDYT